ncbi:MAG TPA: plastocyanin/azurin family copper-binding protein [Thermoleophilaceae bacterium]|nr:plastocyanin/azurin family copper-binding protein [Thermoleophilaceae bacterium]
MRRVSIALAGFLLACLIASATANAAPQTKTFRTGPIKVGSYQVKQSDLDGNIPTPKVSGFITEMDVEVVDAKGRPIPINRLMLHHIVFSNLGPALGSKRDGTCGSFTLLNSRSTVPGMAERFYAAGEERAKLRLPQGYGYKIDAGDKWGMTWMLMNHRKTVDTAYIQYRVTYDTQPRTPVTPYWLDIENCKSDPVFDIPGGKKKGATTRRSSIWNVPASGRIVAGGGHVHGGAKQLDLKRTGPDCTMYSSKPTWGGPKHPFYNVKPVLHEPGPINMSGFTSGAGMPVRQGERLRLDADYDGELMHTRVMGIFILFLAPDAAAPATRSCAPPADLRNWTTGERGRKKPPRFAVPLIGLDGRGKAREIKAPRGARRKLRNGAQIGVGDSFFTRPNVSVAAGSTLKWKFNGKLLHNVTVADGPRGFSSAHLDQGRTYKAKLSAPGTYKLFCALHPVQMTETIKVRSAKRKK